MNLLWFVKVEQKEKFMATTKFNKNKHTQVMLLMNRDLHETFKRKCKEIGINFKNVMEYYSDDFLKELIEKVEDRKIDTDKIITRRKY